MPDLPTTIDSIEVKYETPKSKYPGRLQQFGSTSSVFGTGTRVAALLLFRQMVLRKHSSLWSGEGNISNTYVIQRYFAQGILWKR
jgi:hypothetical protein